MNNYQQDSRLILYFIIGVFALLFFQRFFLFKVSATYPYNCPGARANNATQSECPETEKSGWHCIQPVVEATGSPEFCCLRPRQGTYTVEQCCEHDACGNCSRTCDVEKTCDCVGCGNANNHCDSPCCDEWQLPTLIMLPPECNCYVCPTCSACLANAPAPSCQCQSLTPVKDEVNHTLGFKCLVKTNNDLHITDYTMTIKKPNDSLANLKSSVVDPTDCPQEESGKSCYQVTTTTIDTTLKGTYEMVVPPQITCQ